MPLRLLKTWTAEPELEEVDERTNPDFGILSHRWKRGHEVSLDELNRGLGKEKDGWKKIEQSRALALSEGLQYVWIDTCCIDKTSSTELAESLNSMFRWYSKAKRCYAYLSDVENGPIAIDYDEWRAMHPDQPEQGSVDLQIAVPLNEDNPIASNTPAIEPVTSEAPQSAALSPPEAIADSDNQVQITPTSHQPTQPGSSYSLPPAAPENGHLLKKEADSELGLPERLQTRVAATILPSWRRFCLSVWFKRGWTLQEMIAPKELVFYNSEWKRIGNFKSVIAPGVQIADYVSAVTGVNKSLLFGERTLQSFSIAQKMSWAANRETEREEDRSYSLLGLFDISLTVIYGEGRRAFQRLQEELLRTSSDPTIFAWQQHIPKKGNDEEEEEEELQFSRQRAAPQPKSNLLAVGPEAFAGCGELVPLALEQRMFQVIGGVVQFETRADDNYAVLCASENPSHVIALRLIGKDQYFAAGEERTRSMDIYHAARTMKRRTVSVWRNYEQAPKNSSLLKTILCRSTSERISFESESRGWNSKSQSFDIVDDDFSGHVKFWIGRHRTDFLLSSDSTNKSRPIIKVRFEYLLQEWVLSFPLMLISEASIIRWGSVVHARVRQQRLFDRQLTLVEVEVLPFWRYLLPYIALVFLVLLRGLWMLLRLLTYPLAVVIPIVTIYLMRQRAGFETLEIVGMAVGVPLTMLVVGYYYSMPGYSKFIDASSLVMSKPRGGIYAFNITSVVLCSILLRSLQSRDAQTNASSRGIALIVRISMCALVMVLAIMQAALFRLTCSAIRIGSTLGIALPLLFVFSAKPTAFLPSLSSSCAKPPNEYAAEQACLTQAYEARLQWAIIALSLWECFWALMPGLRMLFFTLPGDLVQNKINDRRKRDFELF